MVESEVYNINLDVCHLRSYTPSTTLCDQLIKYPQEVIPIMDMALGDLCCARFQGFDLTGKKLQVRPFNIGQSINMRDLNPSDVDKLVSIRGLVTRTSHIIPDLKEGTI